MQFVTVRKGGSLNDLVGQIFQVNEAGGEARKQAEAALLQANPNLKDVQQIPEGTLILVPELSGIDTAATAAPSQALHTDAFATLSSIIAKLRQSLTAATEADIARAEATQALIKSKQFTRVVESTEAKSALAEVGKNSQARIKASKALVQTIADALTQAGKDLGDLHKRIYPPTG
jgi:hypothetical protein